MLKSYRQPCLDILKTMPFEVYAKKRLQITHQYYATIPCESDSHVSQLRAWGTNTPSLVSCYPCMGR